MTMASDFKLICVAPELVSKTWPHVMRLINSAFVHGNADSTPADIREDLEAGRSLLWIVWSGTEIIAAATTELINLKNKGKVCLLTTCAGRDLRKWERFIADIERFAKEEGCDYLRFYGRSGWARVLRRSGYEQPWIVLEKGLKG
jgi:hypothetical protein